MGEERTYHEGQTLLRRDSAGSGSSRERSYIPASEVGLQLDNLEDACSRAYQRSRSPKWWTRPTVNYRMIKRAILKPRYTRTCRKRSCCYRLWPICLSFPLFLLGLLAVTGVFFPSYTYPPQRYTDLRRRVLESQQHGAANSNNEKIFIAASLYDEDGGLLGGDWGQSVLHLIDILGHDNVFLSIYENDPSEDAVKALSVFSAQLSCESSVIYEHLNLTNLPHVTSKNGQHRVKRVAFLAEVRNRALRPLEDPRSKAYATRWDKLLYLNDIIFDPIDAANLLFNTNWNELTGRSEYRAACAVDFINPFKFYDTFATRDLEGFDMGVPFYPWFTNAGKGQSRQDVLSQRDAVRVKSCWGGMVAFEAKWFQPRIDEGIEQQTLEPNRSTTTEDDAPGVEAKKITIADDAAAENHWKIQLGHSDSNSHDRSTNTTAPLLRFRSEPYTFWDASECCLIHADLAYQAVMNNPGYVSTPTDSLQQSTGIYMNPHIRVAYSRSTLSWLALTRRFERLYPYVHNLVNYIGDRPSFNPRWLEQPGEEVVHRVWRWTDESLAATQTISVAKKAKGLSGRFVQEKTRAEAGMFCGTRKVYFLKEAKEMRQGERGWEVEMVPEVR